MKTANKIFFSILITIFAINISGCTPDNKTDPYSQKNDDWKYNSLKNDNETIGRNPPSSGGSFTSTTTSGTITLAPAMMKQADFSTSQSEALGFAVGGAKDINNFRDNLKNGFMPSPNDITYEGLFYNYFFDTGKTETCEKLFCPSYSTAISRDPLSNKQEYYLSVGLNSGMKEADFKRKKLNLVVVLDISGSMSANFNQYYYDRFGNKQENEEESAKKTKMEIATKSITKLVDHLSDNDKFGMVLFDDSSYLAKPLTRVAFTNMDKVKDHILEIEPRGGTNMDAGIQAGTKLFEDLRDANPDEYENRIIFITDAMPNLGNTSKDGLFNMIKSNAENKIYTTFIGVGVDLNTDLVETLTKVKGANYYSVHSNKEFAKTVDEDFDYMVTPLVFNLKLNLEAEGYKIEKVYGSPEADQATGEIMKINTLFPSKTEGGETKGGIVLIKLKKIIDYSAFDSSSIKLKVSYEDRNGKKDSDEKEISSLFKSHKAQMEISSYRPAPDIFDNKGIQKAILLVRYVNLLKAWSIDDHHPSAIYNYNDDWNEYRSGNSTTNITPKNSESPNIGKEVAPLIIRDKGIIDIEPPYYGYNQEWERQSNKLYVSAYYSDLFQDFSKYFEYQMKDIDDKKLQQEMDILKKLNSEKTRIKYL